MQYKDGLLNTELANWTNKDWYHQRFDGAPYLLHFIAEAEIRKEERKRDNHFTVHFCFFENDKADWYISMEDINRISKNVIDLGNDNPEIGKALISNWKGNFDQYYTKCKEISGVDLRKLSDEELIKLHDELVELYLNCVSSSSIIDGFALGTDEMIAKLVQEAYDNSDLQKKQRFADIFSALTAPSHLSFVNEAELNLLKVMQSLAEYKELFMQNDPAHIKNQLGEEVKYIKKHRDKYFWIRNNYVHSYNLEITYFIEELKKLFESSINPEEEIAKIENTPKQNKESKERLIELLGLSSDLIALLTTSDDFTYWQDERKRSTFWNAHYTQLILHEIGQRIDIPLELLNYLTPREVSNVFSKIPDKKMLEERCKNSVYFWSVNGMECVSGTQADKVKTAILRSKDLSDVDDFRGLTASTGKATGKVKIVKSAKEIDKVEEGDILVAVMTRPDYLPAMKKAAAIVTDEGGVTCHAAIVSRELGKPCIIGTKIATQVLKDDQTVEVNANHSWVKIQK